MNPLTKATIERKTLIRLAAIAIAYDQLVPNKTELDRKASELLRQEIRELPLTCSEYKEMMERAFRLMEVDRS